MPADGSAEALDVAERLFVGWRRVIRESPALLRLRGEALARGLPDHSVDAATGRLLGLLARLVGARRAVEVGTLGGYSAAWVAQALGPRGRLHTVESNPGRAAAAREGLRRAGLGGRVTVHAGEGLGVLESLRGGCFDFAFFDGDQLNNGAYLDWASRRVRRGGIVVFDDAYRWCRLSPASCGGELAPGPQATRRFLSLLEDTRRFSDSALLPFRKGVLVALRARGPRARE